MIKQWKRWIGAWSALGLVLFVLVGVLHLPAAVEARQDGVWQCAEVNGGTTLNARAGASTAFDVIAALTPGDTLEADFDQRTNAGGYVWLPIRLPDGRTGWAIEQRLDPCPVVPATTAAPTTVSESTADEAVDDVGGGDSGRTPAATATPLPTPSGDGLASQFVNDDGVLDRFEIDAVARSVVLIANVRGTRILDTGTGTIITPDGLIVTNAHVIEDGDQVAIGVLDDINDPPEYRYLGEIVDRDDRIDVALIAIRTDMDGRRINPADLNLPYLPATLDPTTVYRGDPLWIFGYPGIGNDFLIVTTGSIVSVENGELYGERLPVWYRTDAEIGPGNSGGLAVNGNGEFVGIPTFVESEDVTGARLGGIRPAQVALMAVSEGMADDSGGDTILPDFGVDVPVTATTTMVQLQHGVARNGDVGIAFEVAFTLTGWRELPATLVARVYTDDLASLPLINPAAPVLYRDADGGVRVEEDLLPCCTQTQYAGEATLELFFPYAAFGFRDSGAYPLKVQIAVQAEDGSWSHTLSWEFVTITVG